MHHPYQRLDLMGETKKCLGGDNGMLDAGTESRGVPISVWRKRELPSESEGMAEMSARLDSIRLREVTHAGHWGGRHLVELNHRLADRLEVDGDKPLLFSWLG
ncbi:hypothetical protein BHM03_00037929 [Ensete ventricosum]|nr:hypothetical protein BHM03_00037929 [Ensete ventricosum]